MQQREHDDNGKHKGHDKDQGQPSQDGIGPDDESGPTSPPPPPPGK